MNIAMAIFGYALATYFFIAMVVPRIRFRWGYRRTLWPRSEANLRHRKPKMGILSCFGLGISIAAFASVFVVDTSVIETVVPFIFVGFILGFIGHKNDTGESGRWKKY